jgi:thiosulfate/3-mercaptopyruvate sulfurtransferase
MNAAVALDMSQREGTVTSRWLADRLHEPWLRILDVRSAKSFAEGHIPGSSSLDANARLFDEAGAVVSAGELAMAMSEAGVGNEHTVIIIDGGSPATARSAAWALRRYGHAEAYMLAGGFPRWLAERRPVTQELVRHPSVSFTARAPR